MRKEIIASILVALLTMGSAPWWWEKIFGETATAAPASLAAPVQAAVLEPPPPNPPPLVPGAIADANEPAQKPPAEPPPASKDCDGKWFIQIGSGTDKQGLIGFVDKVRGVGGEFAGTRLYTSANGNYAVALGCYDRFTADKLKEKLEADGSIANTPLVTQGSSLRELVY